MTPEPPSLYQRRIAVYAVLLQFLASPGQTYGISVFIDPMIEGLGVSRSLVSGLYLGGTLGAAAVVPAVGRALDGRGLRFVGVGVVALFALALVWLSQVTGPIGLFLGLLGIRAMGQGSLGLIATNAMAVWFRERRGAAMGAVFALSALLFAVWPPGAARLIEAVGWRSAWLALAALVALAAGPIVLFGLRDPPDRQPGAGGEGGGRSLPGWTLAEARRSPAYWLLVMSGAVMAGTITALGFHQISILGERGLDPVAAAENFAPQFVVVALMTWTSGRWSDRFDLRRLVTLATGLMALASLGVLFLEPGWSALLYAVVFGAAAGTWRGVSGAAYPKWFGLANIGAIQGAAARWLVAGSALGPLPVALAHDAFGSYRPAVVALAICPLICVVASFVVKAPSR